MEKIHANVHASQSGPAADDDDATLIRPEADPDATQVHPGWDPDATRLAPGESPLPEDPTPARHVDAGSAAAVAPSNA